MINTEQLNLTVEDYRAVLSCVADGIFIIDSNGIILDVNKAVEQTGGKRMEEVIGRNILDLEKEGYCTEFISKKVIATKQTQTALQMTKGNRELLVTGIPYFGKEGNLKMVIASERDVTELNKVKQGLLKVRSINKQYEKEISRLKVLDGEKNDVICVSSSMKSVIGVAQKAALTDVTVLIYGESGTGKEVVATYIHNESMRNDKPIITVNCGAIPENLMESELFGYVPGAFTGANSKGKMGYFGMANGGTIFLDEIGEIPLNLQVKLLRVLQEKEMTPVGGDKPVKLDIRIIAATNKNLKKMVEQGTFRQDLYYRLSVVNLEIPPLRDRKEDMVVLSTKFLKQFNEKYGAKINLTNKAKKIFLNYDWPGNVRELENMIESIVVTAESDLIDDNTVRKYIPYSKTKKHVVNFSEEDGEVEELQISGSLADMVDEYEKMIIKTMFEKFGDSRRIAEELGTTRSTINRKLAKYEIRTE